MGIMSSSNTGNQRQSKVAVITGSSSGIGRATALRLAADGYSVVLHGLRNVAGVQATATEILERTGRTSLCVLADVADSRSRLDLVRAAFQWQGRVDAWINNAGADVLTTEARHWSFEAKLEHLLATDLVSTASLSREVADRMRQQATEPSVSNPASPPDARPCIINIGWDQALIGMSGDSGQLFCATKAAIMAFTNSFAMTVAPHIRVNCVAPGWIKTAWGDGQDSNDYWDARARGESLLARWGSPDDIAATIAWLVSPHAAFINGQCININGGRRFTAPAPTDWVAGSEQS